MFTLSLKERREEMQQRQCFKDYYVRIFWDQSTNEGMH